MQRLNPKSNRMNFAEREAQKDAARKLLSAATNTGQQAEAIELLAEAYYYRNTDAPSRATYIAHFLAASGRNFPAEAVRLLQRRFRAPRRLKIQPGYSDWNSFGRPEYRAA